MKTKNEGGDLSLERRGDCARWYLNIDVSQNRLTGRGTELRYLILVPSRTCKEILNKVMNQVKRLLRGCPSFVPKCYLGNSFRRFHQDRCCSSNSVLQCSRGCLQPFATHVRPRVCFLRPDPCSPDRCLHGSLLCKHYGSGSRSVYL